ncbi:MAG: hypothetical protein K0R49_1228, partial [Burkholderiales bacterium]|nr:hypothetical protein [Burkholderiales bacterium]
MNRIASVSNNKIKQIVKLANSRSYRNELGLAVIYGQHLVEEAQKQDLLDLVFIDQSKFDNNSFLQHISPEKIYLVNDIVLAKINISDSKTDIIGLIRVKSGTNNSINESDCVILDNIQDPGNLGTIFRSCAACGVVNVILSK